MGRVTFHARSHTIVVILDAENHGKVPQTGHVGALPNLSLVGGAVTVAPDGHLHGLARSGVVVIRERQPKPDRDLRPHDALPAEKVVRLVVKVHGPSLALRLAADIAEELAQDARHRPPPRQRHTVTAVARDPRVLGIERRVDPRGHGLLAVVEVAESADRAGLVFVIAGDFHAAHGVHQFEVGEELVLGHVDRVVRRGFEVVSLEGSGQVEGRDVGGGHEPRVAVGDTISESTGGDRRGRP
mmetsp:Transcript_36159/g.87272  ORF Transcript_36159/g.87272 Transcript_36159/m.87272 type:complete len:242 (-) Transcript_36159:96-821(-)